MFDILFNTPKNFYPINVVNNPSKNHGGGVREKAYEKLSKLRNKKRFGDQVRATEIVAFDNPRGTTDFEHRDSCHAPNNKLRLGGRRTSTN